MVKNIGFVLMLMTSPAAFANGISCEVESYTADKLSSGRRTGHHVLNELQIKILRQGPRKRALLLD